MSRQVILIHGPPASGKLTTARALAGLRPAVVLHNHVTFNAARVLFALGDPRLNALHRELRLVMLRHGLAADDIPEIILTLVYAEPESAAHLEEIESLLREHDAELFPVYLSCTEERLRERVTAPEREAAGKVCSVPRLVELLESHRYPPIRHPRTLFLDNATSSAREVAERIHGLIPPAPPA